MPNLMLILLPAVVVVAVGAALFEEYQKSQRAQTMGYQRRTPSQPRSQSYAKEEKILHARRRNTSSIKENLLGTCEICKSSITHENDLTKLSCDHKYHVVCIKCHLTNNGNERNEAKCPVLNCGMSYSLYLTN